jgi:hypothetical protein
MILRLEHRTKSPVLQKLARRYLHYFAHPVGRWGDLGNVLDGYVDSVMRRPDINEAKRKLYSRGAGTHVWIQVQRKNSRPETMLTISLDRGTSARGWTHGRDERADVTLRCMSRHIKGRLANNECCSIWRHAIYFRPGLASSLTLCDLARRFDWWVTEIASSRRCQALLCSQRRSLSRCFSGHLVGSYYACRGTDQNKQTGIAPGPR